MKRTDTWKPGWKRLSRLWRACIYIACVGANLHSVRDPEKENLEAIDDVMTEFDKILGDEYNIESRDEVMIAHPRRSPMTNVSETASSKMIAPGETKTASLVLLDGISMAARFNGESCMRSRNSSNFTFWESLVRDENSHFYQQLISMHSARALSHFNITGKGVARNAVYVKNQKVASTTLSSAAREYSDSRVVRMGVSQLRQDESQFKPSAKFKVPAACNTFAVYFTFVRDPIDAFVSGFKEAYCRFGLNAWPGAPDTNDGSVIFQSFLQYLLKNRHGGSFLSGQSFHFWPQAYKIDALPKGCELSFIGRLSTFAQSLSALFPRGKIPDKREHLRYGETTARCKRLTFGDMKLGQNELRALCQLLAVDYECFAFALPPVCMLDFDPSAFSMI